MGAGILSNVKEMFGFGEHEDEYIEEGEEDFQPAPQLDAKARQRPLPTPGVMGAQAPSARGNIIGLPANPNSEVVVIEPRSFDEALAILDNLRSRKAVILNLVGLAADQSQRLVDFVSGACHALDGHQEKIGESIFLFTPSNVMINSFHAERDWGVSSQAPKDLFFRVR
jgi:cell division inhibitor SepF